MKPDIFVLDATAFIGLDFPQLQKNPESNFFTTLSVVSELKNFRSRMNLDILKHSGRLQFGIPESNLLKKLKRRIEAIDPQTTLSSTDIEVLALAVQIKGTLISNDLSLQNAALHFKIPIKVISGKKITFLREWQLKCTGCGKIVKDLQQICPICGGFLKRVPIEPAKPKSELME
ncbi:MAG: NOB1 family endonuclease [Promethearchaeota archaeon]